MNNTEKSTNKSRNNSMTTKSKESSLLADVDDQTNCDKKFQGIYQVYFIINYWKKVSMILINLLIISSFIPIRYSKINFDILGVIRRGN